MNNKSDQQNLASDLAEKSLFELKVEAAELEMRIRLAINNLTKNYERKVESDYLDCLIELDRIKNK